MFCRQCGTQNDPGALFWGKCGAAMSAPTAQFGEQSACPSTRRARVSAHFTNPACPGDNPSACRPNLSDHAENGNTAICRRPPTCRNG
jgi:hypothetical protein